MELTEALDVIRHNIAKTKFDTHKEIYDWYPTWKLLTAWSVKLASEELRDEQTTLKREYPFSDE